MSRQIVSPSGKTKTLAPVRPNVGIEIAYRRKLEAFVDEMHKSLVYWLTAAYRANEPEMAADRSPAAMLRTIMRRLARRWTRRIDDAAPELAKYFATAAADRADGAMAGILKRAGMTVKFKLTATVNDVLQASIGENVALIKSIAAEHLADVEGLVMRSVSAGRDLGSLTKDLEDRYGVTRKRAAFIARDQNNKTTATITRVRQQGLGITQAIWLHSAGGRHPRPSHVAASGETYDIERGMFLDGVWTWPGREINCRCVSKSVIPGLD